MQYLLYVEHAAENLQFYLWLRDYTERFNALSENEKALSPPVPVNPLDPRLGPKSGPRPSNSVTKFLSFKLGLETIYGETKRNGAKESHLIRSHTEAGEKSLLFTTTTARSTTPVY